MTIDSTPAGALVYLNDQEVGRTPLKRPFLWYGNYDVALRKNGYETLKTTQDVRTPLFQIVPIDLFTEILPFQFKDEQHFSYNLQPLRNPDTREMIDRAVEMKSRLESSKLPATQPASRTAPGRTK